MLGIEMKNGYILTKDEELVERKTAGGLILPAERHQRFAIVVAIPDGEEHFRVGDIVAKPIGRGTPLKINDIEYECIKAEFIFAIIERADGTY